MAINHEEMAQALRLGHRFRRRNDYVTGTCWYFHGKLLIAKAPGCFLFSLHGWNTSSTRQRINAALCHAGISVITRGEVPIVNSVTSPMSITPDTILVGNEEGVVFPLDQAARAREPHATLYRLWIEKLKPL